VPRRNPHRPSNRHASHRRASTTPYDLTRIESLAEKLADTALLLSWYVGHQQPASDPHITLDQPTKLRWSADLAENLAQNNSNVRDAIRRHDKIWEQQIWPDPGYMASGSPEELIYTIEMWLRLDLKLFEAIFHLYGIDPEHPVNPVPDPPPCSELHDAFHVLALNGIVLIDRFNGGDYDDDKIDRSPCPKPPTSPAIGNEIYSLARLELALHRLAQGHMQILSFIPAHLRFVSANMK
jgi:hypothetical protein